MNHAKKLYFIMGQFTYGENVFTDLAKNPFNKLQ